MKTMKNSKKLFSAVVMLALSAVMLVTSSFAWFSMNTNVKVEGMQVTAIADQVFLQITSAGGTFDNNEAHTAYTYGTDPALNESKYSPVDVFHTWNSGNPDAFKGTLQGEESKLSFCWVTATSNNPTVSDKASDYTKIDTEINETNLSKYCYITSYDLRLDPRAGSVPGGKLKVTSVSLATAYADELSKAVSVLIVCEGENLAILYKQVDGAFKAQTGSADALTSAGFPASTLSTNNIKTVKIYVFFDGNNPACKTVNATATPFAVNVNFNVNAD